MSVTEQYTGADLIIYPESDGKPMSDKTQQARRGQASEAELQELDRLEEQSNSG
jgi:hypothetical protein